MSTITEKNRRVLDLVKTSEIGCWDWDLRTNQLFWNDVNYKVLGLEPFSCEPSFDKFISCVHTDDVEAIRIRIRDTVQSNEIYQHQYRVIWPDGSLHWVVATGKTDYDSNGVPNRMYGTALRLVETEKTLTKRAELEERVRMLENLIRAQEDLMGLLSHELRTPLCTLGIQMELALRSTRDRHAEEQSSIDTQEIFEVANFQTSHLAGLLDKLTKTSYLFGDLFQQPRETLCLNDLVTSTVKTQIQDSAARVQILSTDSIFGKWNKKGIQRVLIELFGSATEFGESKPVQVEVREIDFKASINIKFRISAWSIFDPADISARFQARMPLTTCTDRGLGIYIAREIINEQGGEIKAQFSIKEESSFNVTLPFGTRTSTMKALSVNQ